MMILLSPAKRFDASPSYSNCKDLTLSTPRMRNQTKDLYKSVLDCINNGEFQKLMGISNSLTEVNCKRFREWSPPRVNSKQSAPAILYFKGDVYQELKAEKLPPENLTWLNDHLRILSGFHGLLRPFDVILPYRLEMGSKLKNILGENLYQFWTKSVTKQLLSDLGNDKQPILNLASIEYFKAIDPTAISNPIYTVKFFFPTPTAGYKQFGYPAKRARGLLTRWIAENKVTKPSDILAFNEHDFKYSPQMSDADNNVIAFYK